MSASVRLHPRLLVIATGIALLLAGSAAAAPADLDPAYGTGGTTSRQVLPGTTFTDITPTAAVRLDGGDSIIAGHTADGRIFAVRLEPSGEIDPAWGDYRYLNPSPGLTPRVSFAGAHGDALIIGGGAGAEGFLARLTVTAGAPDVAFGIDGIVRHLQASGSGAFNDGVLDTDGGIYAVTTAPVTVRRYLPTGALDGTFGDSGRQGLPRDPGNPKLALDGQRRIHVGGTLTNGTSYRFALMEGMAGANPGTLLSIIDAGGLQTSAVDIAADAVGRVYLLGARVDDGYELKRFDGGDPDESTSGALGTITSGATFATDDHAVALTVTPDGQATVVGMNASAGGELWAESWSPAGFPALTFNGAIARTISCEGPPTCTATAVATAPTTGEILIVGRSGAAPRGHAAVVENDGTLDLAFGGDGVGTFAPARPWESSVIDTAVAPDGALYVLGESGPPLDERTWITKQLPGGAPDPAFGTDGVISADLSPGGPDYVSAIALTPSGALHTVRGVSGAGFSLQRWTASGLDTTYGTGGELPVAVGGIANAATALESDAQGRLVVAGNGRFAGDQRSWLVRLAAETGSVDPDWNGGNVTSIDAGPALTERLDDLQILDDGSVAAASDIAREAAVIRLGSDGRPVPGFGGSPAGLVRIPQLGQGAPGAPVVIGGRAGAIVVARTEQTPARRREIVAARLRDDGTLDPAFASGAVARLGDGDAEPEEVADLAVDSSGRTAIVGRRGTGAAQDALLARLTPTGDPDATFGAGGLAPLDLSGAGRADGLLRVAALESQALLVAGQAVDGGGADLIVSARFLGGPRPVAPPPSDPGPQTGGDGANAPGGTSDTPRTPGTGTPLATRTNALPTFRTRISVRTRTTARTRLTIRGTASATPLAVRRVQISVRRIERGACRYLRSTRSPRLVTRPRTAGGGCTSPRWLTVTGTSRWRATLTQGLPAGRYEIRARAIAADGSVQASFVRRVSKVTVQVRAPQRRAVR